MPGTAVAPTASAAGPPPAARTSALSDLLGTTLGDLLGGAPQRQQLQDAAGALQGGALPTGALLAPLQDLLVQLAGTPGLPAESQGLIAQVAALLGSTPADQPLDAHLLAPVTTLLRDLAATDGVPSETATLVRNLADLLDGDGTTPALPLETLGELPPALIEQLRQLLTALEDGQQPTGTLLAPVGDLLGSVAAEPELPASLASLLQQARGWARRHDRSARSAAERPGLARARRDRRDAGPVARHEHDDRAHLDAHLAVAQR